MARPRQHTDHELLELAGQAISRRGSSAPWSLADVARDSGVHSATYIKRFGSKNGLVLAMTRAWSDSIPTAARTPEPLAELREWILDSYAQLGDPETISGNIAALSLDMAVPVLRDAVAQARHRQAHYVSDLLSAARATRTLMRMPEPADATAVVLAVAEGTVIRWAAEPHHPLTSSLDHALTILLDSWRRP